MARPIVILLALLFLAVPIVAPCAADYRARTVYFLMADRFHAHSPYDPYVDPEHPNATNDVNCFEVTCTQEKQWRSYWGGDVKGIIQKLDYLQRLGVSAVWVTPLMENVRAYEGGTGYGTGYHGYWVQNYDRVNAHFGDWQDVARLSRELHARGMNYIQDITLNHSNPLDNHVDGQLYAGSRSERVFIKSYEQDHDRTGTRLYKHYQGDPRCQQVVQQGLPDYEWTYWQLHHCLLADLSGYDQRVPTIADYLIGAGKLWLDRGVDDFRLDAIKFPFPSFVARFTHAMTGHQQARGRMAPFFFGEWSHGGVGDAKSLRFANKYDRYRTHILDFSLSLALNRFVGGAAEPASEQLNAQGLDQLLRERVVAFQGRDDWTGTFIDNHDQMRTLVRLQKLGVTEAERERRLDLAHVLLLTVRGIPIVCYGDEQYLAWYDDGHDTPPEDINSDDDDPYNRPGLTRWNEATPAFRTIRALAGLRQRSAAVQKGAYRAVLADGDVLVFERRHGGESVLVAVNRGTGATTVDLGRRVDLPPGAYLGLLRDASPVNRGNTLLVRPIGSATLRLAGLSSLVARVER
jgi:cyclomaltodextrin glucanotransferase